MSWLIKFLASRPLLDQVVGRIVRSDEIEDIVQDTFVCTYVASRRQFIKNPQAFILKTAKNIALNYINKSERKLSCSLEEFTEIDFDTEGNTLEDQCEADENFLIFCRAVAKLPVSCRRTFILKKIYGMSQKEIAVYLDISTSTVEKHVANGMLKIAQYMGKTGQNIGLQKTNKRTRKYTDMEQKK